MWSSIIDLLLRTLLVAEPYLHQTYHACRPFERVANAMYASQAPPPSPSDSPSPSTLTSTSTAARSPPRGGAVAAATAARVLRPEASNAKRSCDREKRSARVAPAFEQADEHVPSDEDDEEDRNRRADSQQPVNDSVCFEVLGFDVLIDEVILDLIL